MKILHITTMDHGGAGIAARRIHEALLKQGVESRMLVRFKKSDDDTITMAQPNKGLYSPPSIPLCEKIVRAMRRRGRCLTEVEHYERQMELLDRQHGAAFTMPISNYDLTNHPLLQWADILHLHWVENFLDYPTFFSAIEKPVVWTFHDENIAYGGFHYTDEAERLKEPFAKLENAFCKIKKDAFADAGHSIHMVALSAMMEQFCHQHALMTQLPVEVIHNGIRPEDFNMLDRHFCRETLGIPDEKRVLCFCASDINDNRKGLDTLVRVLESMHLSNIALLCVGQGRLPKCDISIIGTGPITNPRLLSVAYSAADLFVMPSYQEAFAQAPLEAMACGCPVVAFPCSGTEELIREDNGVRCSDFTEQALADGIGEALERMYSHEAIRRNTLARFDIAIIAHQYINLYNRCK